MPSVYMWSHSEGFIGSSLLMDKTCGL
uniref:Uncharacterized protein n=1 Tax=Rhizophora mucronata TaxID=61149 RepID=A0A2P2QGL0_RHIMU